MRILKYIASIGLALSLGLFASSCSNRLDDSGVIGSAVPENMRALDVELSIVNANPTTSRVMTPTRATENGNHDQSAYGVTDLNENLVSTIELFLFDNAGALLKHYPNSEVNRESTSATTYNTRILIPQAEATKYAGQNIKIVAVVNAKADLSAVKSLADLQAASQEDVLNPEPAVPQEKFLMDGTVQTGIIQWTTDRVYTAPTALQLKRAVAKIRLRIDPVLDIKDFQNGIEKKYIRVGEPRVALFRYVQNTSLVAGAPVAAKVWATSSSYRTMAVANFPANGTVMTGGNFWTSFPFYAYENSWGPTSMDETYLQVAIKLYPEGQTEADAKDYYYVLPVNYRKATAVATTPINCVVRNYLYDVYTKIDQLGSIDESTPVQLTSNLAIQPWVVENIDGSVLEAKYLVVKETNVLMPNVATRDIAFISSTPVTITINEIYSESYSVDGTPVKTPYPNTRATITAPSNVLDGNISIKSVVPITNVPLKIVFTVTQTGTNPLSQKVTVTQYPSQYVTGKKNTLGLKGGTSTVGGVHIDADFRYHTSFGALATYPGESTPRAQKNDVLYRVTTLVPAVGQIVGDPVDAYGYTKRDEESNKMISPEFIIASQYGMSVPVFQTGDFTSSIYGPGWTMQDYAAGYGPYSSRYPTVAPYKPTVASPAASQPLQLDYTSAENRCANYFEGEYGMDGVYREYYVDEKGASAYRDVTKTFTYKGQWRVPTLAELAIINSMQDSTTSLVKYLLYGEYYWAAQTDRAFNMNSNGAVDWSALKLSTPADAWPVVRCVFDTWKLPNRTPY